MIFKRKKQDSIIINGITGNISFSSWPSLAKMLPINMYTFLTKQFSIIQQNHGSNTIKICLSPPPPAIQKTLIWIKHTNIAVEFLSHIWLKQWLA